MVSDVHVAIRERLGGGGGKIGGHKSVFSFKTDGG